MSQFQTLPDGSHGYRSHRQRHRFFPETSSLATSDNLRVSICVDKHLSLRALDDTHPVENGSTKGHRLHGSSGMMLPP
jgi:hypothetical protein